MNEHEGRVTRAKWSEELIWRIVEEFSSILPLKKEGPLLCKGILDILFFFLMPNHNCHISCYCVYGTVGLGCSFRVEKVFWLHQCLPSPALVALWEACLLQEAPCDYEEAIWFWPSSLSCQTQEHGLSAWAGVIIWWAQVQLLTSTLTVTACFPSPLHRCLCFRL